MEGCQPIKRLEDVKKKKKKRKKKKMVVQSVAHNLQFTPNY
jgi:hypothetical protein